jgi:hypothetical protein
MLASLDIATGDVHSHMKHRRQSVGFIAFMDGVSRRCTGARRCVILDNLNTLNNAAAKEWLALHPQITCRFTSTHASWTNLIECFLSILTKQGLPQAGHNSRHELAIFLK